MLAMMYLLREAKLHPTKHHIDPAFKVAIFFSAIEPIDLVILEETGAVVPVAADGSHPLVRIPVAHIWGKNDEAWNKGSETVAALCDPEKRAVYIHDGGHEVPSAKDVNTLYRVVHTIRRTIDAAAYAVTA
jgi:hypothetical protein